MPVAIPNDVGAPRATSRRGGRSRSPVSNTPRDEAPSTAAAAAAAAAAKAYRSWPGEGGTPERTSDQHIFRQAPGTPGTAPPQPGQPPWPPGSPASYHGGPPPPGYPPHPHHHHRGGGRYHPPPPHHPAYGADPHYDPRAMRGGPPRYGGPGYPPPHPRYDPHPPPYPGRYGGPPHRRMRPPSLPKSPKPRNRASVFRKPPETASEETPKTPNDDEDSPQRILLSLRTPSHSFDQKDSIHTSILKGGDEDVDLETKIKSDEARRSSPTDPLLVPQRSVDYSRVGSIDMAPSFTLFNQSFDSFANDGHLSLNADSFGFGRTESAAMDGILRQSNTFAYSPVHSFDAAAAAAPVAPTTQVLYRRPFSPMMPPNFYAFLGKYKEAFAGCTFLLPGLKQHVVTEPSKPESSKSEETPDAATSQPSPPTLGVQPTEEDLAIAKRRIQSSICAFGGSLHHDVNNENKRQKVYADALGSRYYENESRLSWEFEENPPIVIEKESQTKKIDNEGDDETDKDGNKSSNKTPDATVSGKHDSDESVNMDGMSVKSGSDEDNYCRSVSSEGDHCDKKSHGSQSKMKYRCKLCGQPKQNHRCPYQQSLARSIGVMIYPAVNAFTADEPGVIAPPLSEMNNFVDVQKSDMTDATPSRPMSTTSSRRLSVNPTAQVTPESLVSGRASTRNRKKRLYSQTKGDQGDLLFVESMEVQPVQFKTVSSTVSTSGGFKYAPLPLPYAQRKRLSDNLFTLSNDVPKLTNECAQVLREAREKDTWDLAVAELMTQVIVIIHCNERDVRFEGLRQYLLTLGIAC